ncbi:hypothetical protein BVC80_205g78 [Macleaya cordata]|uniref:Uncharacterized protein n=1 Tax=Macleaya cordata TaxID=56857 RepID=A0A200PZ15_MACCD|nr:hypothetical protein BVC80_205g78 [Macleaya cordata]
MEELKQEPEKQTQPQPKLQQTLSPSSSGRRSNHPNSPEFEFWMVRNPSFPQPNLHSADELFVDGIILPLCLLSHHSDPPDDDSNTPEKTPTSEPETELKSEKPEICHEPGSEPGPGPESATVLSSSKRWRDIFKVGDKKNTNNKEDRGGDKEKKKDRKSSSGTNNTAELNINIWPFSRSRSAGNSGNRPKMAAATRKVSSAPCSRSNSGGESKSKKWPNSPSRGGIHLGRSSPVWQVRRGATGVRSSEGVARSAEKGVKKDGSLDSRWSKSRLGVGGGGSGGGGGGVVGGLNLNVQMCMGYRQNSSCRSDENSSLVGGEQSCSGGATGNGGNGVKLFNLRTLFSKKVY